MQNELGNTLATMEKREQIRIKMWDINLVAQLVREAVVAMTRH